MVYSKAPRLVIVLLATTALGTSACTTMGGMSGGPRSELDKANDRCVAAVLVGALAGAIVGNNVGDGNAGRGAAIGAGAGGLACLVIRAAAREKDAILAYQAEAAKRGTGRTEQWTAASGERMTMSIQVDDDDAGASAVTSSGISGPEALCRYSRSSIAIEGMGSTDLGRQRWCERPDGTWAIA